MGEMKVQCLLYHLYRALHAGRKALIGHRILCSDWLNLEPLALDNPTRSIAIIIILFIYFILLYFNIYLLNISPHLMRENRLKTDEKNQMAAQVAFEPPTTEAPPIPDVLIVKVVTTNYLC